MCVRDSYLCPPPRPQDFYAAVAEHSVKQINALKPAHLAKLAWALAVRKVRHTTLYGAISRAAFPLLGSFKPQPLSQLIFSFAKQGYINKMEEAMIGRAADALLAQLDT